MIDVKTIRNAAIWTAVVFAIVLGIGFITDFLGFQAVSITNIPIFLLGTFILFYILMWTGLDKVLVLS